MSYSDDGTEALRYAARAGAGAEVPFYARAAAPSGRVGFVKPSALYDRTRALDVKVASLGSDIAANVPPTDPMVGTWKAWRANWEAFRDRTLKAQGSWNPLLTGPAVLSTDETNAQLDQYQRELDGWFSQYASRGGPPPSAPSPGAPPERPASEPWFPNPFKPGGTGITDIVPWWLWALGIGGVALVGYSIYKTASVAKRQAAEGESLLRGLALQRVGAGGDFARDLAPAAPSVVIHAGSAASSAVP